ncbi:amidase domain-containing protein [Kitasatospora sp. NPDC008050]|uniref:amidase domain-containing protein n=1 Tax=Kitasatospora sp. NPDC008050 TaxID=3364021 RepID=UPI0036E8B6A8
MQHAIRRRIAGAALIMGLVGAGAPALAAPAFADTPTTGTTATAPADLPSFSDLLRGVTVDYAEAHWNWTAWNDSTPVAFGADQDNYQCAEFVARSLAAAGLVPGLGPDDPQDSYFHYTAPNGKTYDLLLITDLPQYHNLYDYLMDSGLGTDVGDHPEQARPGDVVVTYAGPNGAKTHTGLVATAADGTTEATVDAHNRARNHYGYHFYAPSHLIRIEPLGLLTGFGANTDLGAAAAAPKSLMVTPKAAPKAAPKSSAPLLTRHDPAGPQV